MRPVQWLLPGLFLTTLVFASSAFGQDVSFNFDSKADFSKYKTYRWEKHPQSMDIDPLTMNQLGATLDLEFAKKGITKTDNGAAADLVIVYQLAIRSEKELTTYSSGFSTGPYWGGGWYGGGGGYSTTSVNTLMIGTLGLDIYDPETKQLIWRGVATKTLDVGAKPDKRQKNMTKGVAKLLKNFPPPVKTKKD